MRTEFAPSWPVSIFIAGNASKASRICQAFCDEVGLCVTVRWAEYVYTDGAEPGVIVGLINYPRFPKEPVHRRFARHHLRGEWYERCPAIEAEIERLKTGRV